MKKFLIFVGLIFFLTLCLSFLSGRLKTGPKSVSPSPVGQSQPRQRLTVLASGLNVPWEMVFLPNKDILLTERVGNLDLLSSGKVSLVAKIPQVKVFGEGGLLGLALSPSFSSNHYIFVYYTYAGSGNSTKNRVVRYEFKNNSISNPTTIVDGIPGAIYHNGGRIKFGPDNFLYITTGDSRDPSLAQNKNSLAGKILRVGEDGKAAPDNPFKNQVYSYGHRNPQGLAWDSSGRLYATEHGPSGEGGLCCRDEVNVIAKGGNYGWPTITGSQTKNGMITPFLNSGNDTWAPAADVFYKGSLFFAGLKGESLYEVKIKGNVADLSTHLSKELGRIRSIVLGPYDYLYILTSNKDGRGTIHTGDDRLIKIDPSQI